MEVVDKKECVLKLDDVPLSESFGHLACGVNMNIDDDIELSFIAPISDKCGRGRIWSISFLYSHPLVK